MSEMALATEPVQTGRAALDVYGLRFELEGWADVVEAARLDFAWFENDGIRGAADLHATVERREPDFDAFGDLTASFITPRNVVYQQGARKVVDYFGRVVAIFDPQERHVLLQGTDATITHEALYQFLVSHVGEHVEKIGLPRLHGLALSGRQGAVVVMLPSGGGKTTLGLRALRDGNVKLLSEDSALLDRRGYLHPFPLRIGVNATDAKKLPAGHVRRIERMELHPKIALEIEAFRDRIEHEPQPLRHIVIGRRSLGSSATLKPLPRRSALPVLFREAVVGVGIYQGMEWLLQHGMRDVVRQTYPALTRSRCCLAGLRRANVWLLTVGRDHERNWSTLHQLLD